MYSQFCKNLFNFININTQEGTPPNIRLKYAIEVMPLTDVKSFLKYKSTNEEKYREIGNFIFELSKNKCKYPSLEKFIWELWAYGFDIIPYNDNDGCADKYLDEKIKLVDLMLSTHYFSSEAVNKM